MSEEIQQQVISMIASQLGKNESEIMPHRESIEILETMDYIRTQWGLR